MEKMLPPFAMSGKIFLKRPHQNRYALPAANAKRCKTESARLSFQYMIQSDKNSSTRRTNGMTNCNRTAPHIELF